MAKCTNSVGLFIVFYHRKFIIILRRDDIVKNLEDDRYYLENKYHRTNEDFDPLKRMNYHGYEYDPSTGLNDEEMRLGLTELSKKLDGFARPVVKAKCVEFVLDNMRIDVNEHDWFVGLYNWNRAIDDITINRWVKEIFEERIPEIGLQREQLSDSGAVAIWPDFDHVVPDWNAILKLGFGGILNRAVKIRQERRDKLTQKQEEFFEAIEIEYRAIIRLIDRIYLYSLTKPHKKADKIAECLKSIRDGAPQNTYEALQVMYIFFMICEYVEHYQTRSIGNGLDSTLYEFYKRDIESGRFTKDEIKEFLAYFMMQFSAIGNYWGHPFYMGGTKLNGESKINELSYDILDVYEQLEIYSPKIQVKLNHNTPKDFVYKVLELIRKGSSSFVFCCEPAMVDAIMSYGASYEEAWDFDIRGCYETGVRANEVSTVTGYINSLKAITYVFSNGFDKGMGMQVGIRTGDIEEFICFEDFYNAFLRQWKHLIESAIKIANSYEVYLEDMNPSPMYSATIEYTMDKMKDGYAGGVKFNNSALLNCGFASAIDSLMAVKEFVFDKKEITLAELRDALEKDWKGYEIIQSKILNSSHKYGNNDYETDMYAKALSYWFCSQVNNRSNGRGGVYKSFIHSAMQFVWGGKKTEATPDGRKRGAEYSKNASPSVGMDKKGVTALIKSVLKLNPKLYNESMCVDITLHPSAISGEDGLSAMYALLKAYLKNGGMAIQFNIFDADELREAQKKPEKYENLQVRVCGWNVLWNNLSREEQNAYIKRAEGIE